MKKRIQKSAFFLAILSSCTTSHLSVQEVSVDKGHLASMHVGAPDPMQENYPSGKELLISWHFPDRLWREGLWLRITVRFWDLEEEVIEERVSCRRRSFALGPFAKRVLTYRIDVVNSMGREVESWEHQLWVRLIKPDKSSSRVLSQPRQESVTERSEEAKGPSG